MLRLLRVFKFVFMKKNKKLATFSSFSQKADTSCAASCQHPCIDRAVHLGLSVETIRYISAQKKEPQWMLEYRLRAFDLFHAQENPHWGPDISQLSLDNIVFYKAVEAQSHAQWGDVSQQLQQTFEDLGVRKAERDYLGGLGAQYESEMVYHHLKEELSAQGVIFLNPEQAVIQYPDLVQKYFGSVVSPGDNKFAALNTAVWSGGTFIYVPPGVHVTVPLQTYFRIDSQGMGQFERTLIIVDKGSLVTYVEGCTAPTHASYSLHSAVVEIVALEGARVRYYTIQNWSKNVYNLVTKRAAAYKNAIVEWIDGNLGSAVTMKYPAVILKEPGASADILSVAMASMDGQIQDSGGKVIHEASSTTSKIISKSIACNGGRTSYRGAVIVRPGATGCKSFVQCHNLLLDEHSRADAYPYMDIQNPDVEIGHEATVSRVNEEQLFYLQSRGLDAHMARTFVVNGFIEPFVKELPMEFAVEMNRLIEMEMEHGRE